MLEISTSAQCPICEKHWLDYENGKFICKECKSVIDINITHGNYADLDELLTNEWINKIGSYYIVVSEC